MARIIVGNVHIEDKPTVVELRLVTNANGVAIFGYGEIPGLIAALKKLRPPTPIAADDEDDWRALV
jgi:hypothetical protein